MNSLLSSQIAYTQPDSAPYTQLSTYYDATYQAIWYYMHGAPRPCFTPTLLGELQQFHNETAREIDEGRAIQYTVLASKVPGVFNLGGDLALFRTLIQAQDRHMLLRYAKACIDALYGNMVSLNRNITTIALVQGDALGGGFEAALSSNVLVAERSAKMGLPEILFNLFPGMGAYSILSRKLDSARAERMILSGKIYSAEELYNLGVVDVLAEDGEGERAVYNYIMKENKSRNGYRALRAAKHYCNPISYEELMGIVNIWVDAALRLAPQDLRMMERLVARQSLKVRNAA